METSGSQYYHQRKRKSNVTGYQSVLEAQGVRRAYGEFSRPWMKTTVLKRKVFKTRMWEVNNLSSLSSYPRISCLCFPLSEPKQNPDRESWNTGFWRSVYRTQSREGEKGITQQQINSTIETENKLILYSLIIFYFFSLS